jgi:putative acetyltransferase
MMTIRKLQRADNKILADIIRKVFIEHDAPQEGTVFTDPSTDDLFELFKREKSVLFVAEEDSEIFGCCGIYPTDGLPEGCVELVKFYLAAKARGKGIGLKLLEKSLETAKEMDYNQMYIESLPDYAAAVSMYEKAGFKLLDKRLGDSGHPTCTIWMQKDL